MIKVFKLKKRLACYPERKYYTGQVDGNVIKVYTDENKFNVYLISQNEPYNGILHESKAFGKFVPPLLLDYFDIVDVDYADNKLDFYVNFRLKYYNKEKFKGYAGYKRRKYNERMKRAILGL